MFDRPTVQNLLCSMQDRSCARKKIQSNKTFNICCFIRVIHRAYKLVINLVFYINICCFIEIWNALGLRIIETRLQSHSLIQVQISCTETKLLEKGRMVQKIIFKHVNFLVSFSFTLTFFTTSSYNCQALYSVQYAIITLLFAYCEFINDNDDDVTMTTCYVIMSYVVYN